MAVVINGSTGIDKVQDNTITSAKIVDGTVASGDLVNTYLTSTGDGSGLTGISSSPHEIRHMARTQSLSTFSSAADIFSMTFSLSTAQDIKVECFICARNTSATHFYTKLYYDSTMMQNAGSRYGTTWRTDQCYCVYLTNCSTGSHTIKLKNESGGSITLADSGYTVCIVVTELGDSGAS